MAKSSKPKRIVVARGGAIVAGPLVGSDSVFVGAKDDVTVRLDRHSLKPVWRVDSDGYRPGQLINGDLMTVGGREVGGVRSTTDGRLIWHTRAPFAGVAKWRDCVVVTTTEIELRHPRTGDLLRAVKVSGVVEDAGTNVGALWILPTDTDVMKAINLESGDIVWEREMLNEMSRYLKEPEQFKAIAITQGSIEDLFIACRGDSTFGCSLRDGSIVWHAPVAVPYYWPMVQGGRVYVLLFDRFIAIDEATGRILYDVKHRDLGGVYRPKAGTIYHERIAVPNESGHVAVFNLADGALVSLHEDKLPLWRTAEADGRLFVTTGDGKLLVFDESIWG